MVLKKSNNKAKIIVLRSNIDKTDATVMVDKRKTIPFKSLLSRPKKGDVHIDSLDLYYECILMVSGEYVADYFRNASHSISVDSNVHEISLNGGIFPIRSKSGITKAFVGKRGKNKVDLNLEEHVFVEDDEELTFDHHGRITKFPFKINSKTVENYPQRLLEQNSSNVKRSEISHDLAIEKLQLELKKPLKNDVRDLNEEFTLHKIHEVYIPIFEARLIGPKKKVGIIRIDAVRKKFL